MKKVVNKKSIVIVVDGPKGGHAEINIPASILEKILNIEAELAKVLTPEAYIKRIDLIYSGLERLIIADKTDRKVYCEKAE